LKRFSEAGFAVKEGEKSIHDAESIRFAKEILNEGQWHENVLRNGLSLDLKEQPVQYREKNNVSAQKNMSVLKDKVAEWLSEGHVERLKEPAWCTNQSDECSRQVRSSEGRSEA
jgi:hypothetical protein